MEQQTQKRRPTFGDIHKALSIRGVDEKLSYALAHVLYDLQSGGIEPPPGPVKEVTPIPYTVEEDPPGCATCGKGKTWHVIDPDGIAGATSYFDEDRADDLAADLNHAYAKGLAVREDRESGWVGDAVKVERDRVKKIAADWLSQARDRMVEQPEYPAAAVVRDGMEFVKAII